MGNPPFAGAKFQSAEQRQQVRKLARLGGSGGTLDFVAAWFIKAGEYCSCISIGNGLTSNLEPRTSNLEPRTSNPEPPAPNPHHPTLNIPAPQRVRDRARRPHATRRSALSAQQHTSDN